MTRSQIIILNGVGSVGKSSIAREIQAIAARPFLHVAMDAFLEMLPAAMMDHPDGLLFETTQEEGRPSIAIKRGPVLDRTLRGMRHAIAAMAAQGNDMVVDEVMLGLGEAQAYRDLLTECDLRLVGLFAPLDVLERRERERGDRAIGLARWQFDRVHRDVVYDLKIDATAGTPAEHARAICEAFGL